MDIMALTSIDEKIGQYIKDNNLTRGQMADMLGMSANTLRWKREGKNPWLWDEILHLSDILGMSPDELAGINKAVMV